MLAEKEDKKYKNLKLKPQILKLPQYLRLQCIKKLTNDFKLIKKFH